MSIRARRIPLAISAILLGVCAGGLAFLPVMGIGLLFDPHSPVGVLVWFHTMLVVSSLAAGTVAAWSECSSAKALGAKPRGMGFGLAVAYAQGLLLAWLFLRCLGTAKAVFTAGLMADLPIISLAGVLGERLSRPS
jgi:hypothetical protein